jgi:uncharacterized protein YhaN
MDAPFKKRREEAREERKAAYAAREAEVGAALDEIAEITDPASKLVQLGMVLRDMEEARDQERKDVIKQGDRTFLKTYAAASAGTVAVGVGVGLATGGLGLFVTTPLAIAGAVGSDKHRDRIEDRLLAEAEGHRENMEALRARILDEIRRTVSGRNLDKITESRLCEKAMKVPFVAETFREAAQKREAVSEKLLPLLAQIHENRLLAAAEEKPVPAPVEKPEKRDYSHLIRPFG